MKILFTLLLNYTVLLATAAPAQTFNKLCELNTCWAEQTDIDNLPYPEFDNRNEQDWIRTHLQLVEQTLRNRSTEHLSTSQKVNRLAALDQLNNYWNSGAFPVNDEYNYRTPIFIDKYDNFCAVGYLVKATGHEDVSRMIAAKTNLAYVREMNYTELFAWANEYGFTVDELAWIQPNYTTYPSETSIAIGKGTNGSIYEMYVGDAGNRMYIGGDFDMVDSTISAGNIAYLTDSNNVYTWHNMGLGVNGKVNAIVEFDNKVFIGGHFNRSGTTPMSSIAWWDGANWQRAGCIDGIVKDLVVYNNILYACGMINMCNGETNVNFVKWNGTIWQALPGLKGGINVMYVSGNELLLGGAFAYNSQNENIIRWHNTNGFTTYAGKIDNEVTDIINYNGYNIASAKSTVNKDYLLYKDSAGLWTGWKKGIGNANVISYNTLCVEDSMLWVGGNFSAFEHDPVYQWNYVYTHNMNIRYDYWLMLRSNPGFYLDGSIDKFAMFKGNLIGAGGFTYSYIPYTANKQDKLYGIFYHKKYTPPPPKILYWEKEYGSNAGIEGDKPTGMSNINKVADECNIYPNPVSSGSTLSIKGDFGAKYLKLYDLVGKQVLKQTISNYNQVNLPSLAPGIYIAELSNAQGEKAVNKIIVE